MGSTVELYSTCLTAIAALPPGRQKTILARKALAAQLGLVRTDSLKTYDLFKPENAYVQVSYLAKHGPHCRIPLGYEPRDDSDKTKNPHSLEAFSKAQQTA